MPSHLKLTSNPQHEIDNHSSQQSHSQDARSESIIESTLSSLPYTLRPPVESDQRIYHRSHGDEGEEAGRDATNGVTEVKEADGQTAEDDGEIEP